MVWDLLLALLPSRFTAMMIMLVKVIIKAQFPCTCKWSGLFPVDTASQP